VRRLAQQLHRVARRKGEEAAEELTDAYRRLIRVAEQCRTQAEKVTAVLKTQAARDAQPLGEQVE